MKFEKAVALAPLTTFKIGGPAKFFYQADTEENLIKALKQAADKELPVFILGKGSNVLIADKGFDGLVIKCDIKGLNIKDDLATIGAGENLNEVIGKCAEQGLGGIEFLAGVPCTIGGAIWANAGSKDQGIGDFVEKVKVIDAQVELKELTKADCQFNYRESIFKHKAYHIVEVVFKLQKNDTEEIKKKITENIQQKQQKQDLTNPSAGSVFRNPPGNKSAGQLIDSLGLKGYTMGGAKISEKHANFIINTGKATADDVIMLISYIKQQARDELGVQLQEEVKYIGF